MLVFGTINPKCGPQKGMLLSRQVYFRPLQSSSYLYVLPIRGSPKHVLSNTGEEIIQDTKRSA